MQVGGEARVRELRGSVVVVDKVNPPGGCVPYLPSRRQRTQFLTVHITQISEMQHARSADNEALVRKNLRKIEAMYGGDEGGKRETKHT